MTVDRVDPGVEGVALALWVQGEGRRAAAELRDAGVPVLLLKGPDLQARLYGTPAAYASGDVDVLVPVRAAATARRVLVRHGWSFSPDNGVLWRTSRAAAYDRGGFRLDLHWGLHAAHLPAWSLRSLERRLWSGARLGPSGMLEPDIESLLVFLAVHVVGHSFERDDWSENVQRAAALVDDWSEVWRIARAAKVVSAVHAALDGTGHGRPWAVLDGDWGRFVSAVTWFARGHFIPRPTRDRVRESMALWREGFGFLTPGRDQAWSLRGLSLISPPGVFRPWELSVELADAGLAAIEGVSSPLVVDVGTGTGAVALLLAHGRSGATVVGTDRSSRAIRAARANRVRAGIAQVAFVQGDLLDPVAARLRGRVDLVISNVPADPPSIRGSRRDPRRTLVGPGIDGLDLMRRLARDATEVLAPGGRLLLMLRPWQFEALVPELHSLGYSEIASIPSEVQERGFFCMAWKGNDA